MNEVEKRMVFYEVKRNPLRISLGVLKNKAKNIVAKYPGFSVEYKGLSLEDI